MEKDYKNNDPEKLIFGTALNSLQIEPSEKFWNSALHGIIDKGNAATKKRIKTWQAVSFGLTAVIAGFCIHDYLVSNKIDKIEQQVLELKQDKNNKAEIANNIAAVSENKSASQTTTNKVSGSVNQTSPEENVVTSTANKVRPKQHAYKYSSVVVNNNSIQNKSSVPAIVASTVNNGNAGSVQNNIQEAAIPASNQPAANTENQLGLQASKEDNIQTVQQQPELANNNLVKQKSDSAAAIAKADSMGSLPPIEQTQPSKPKISLAHRLSVSAFFAPGNVSRFLFDNDNADNVTAAEVNSRERDWFAYQAGVKLGFDVSRKFKINSGIYYNAYSYDIKQTIITAQQQDDGVGYSMVTSSGVVSIPYSGQSPKVGDSIKIHGSSSTGYICIPLQLSYLFATHKKFGFYVDAGLVASFATYSGTSLNWENTLLQEGNVSVTFITGLQKMLFGYNFGIGANYMIANGLSIFAEPLLRGSITSISTNTPIVCYPFFMGCSAGLTYHF